MADGLNAANLANKWLAVLAGTTFTAPATTFAELHTGSPGANGTANLSSVTTRPSLAWGTAAGGSLSQTGTPTWPNWAGLNGEIVTDIAVWDAASGGNFLFSTPLTTPQVMTTGQTLQLVTLTVAMIPIAA